jgi:hypothetical protein
VVLGVVRDLRSPRSIDDHAEAAAYQEHLLAEFVLARLAHGVADSTIRAELAVMEEFLGWAGVWAWEIQPAHADRFLGQAQPARPVGREGAARVGEPGPFDGEVHDAVPPRPGRPGRPA